MISDVYTPHVCPVCRGPLDVVIERKEVLRYRWHFGGGEGEAKMPDKYVLAVTRSIEVPEHVRYECPCGCRLGPLEFPAWSIDDSGLIEVAP